MEMRSVHLSAVNRILPPLLLLSLGLPILLSGMWKEDPQLLASLLGLTAILFLPYPYKIEYNSEKLTLLYIFYDKEIYFKDVIRFTYLGDRFYIKNGKKLDINFMMYNRDQYDEMLLFILDLFGRREEYEYIKLRNREIWSGTSGLSYKEGDKKLDKLLNEFSSKEVRYVAK